MFAESTHHEKRVAVHVIDDASSVPVRRPGVPPCDGIAELAGADRPDVASGLLGENRSFTRYWHGQDIHKELGDLPAHIRQSIEAYTNGIPHSRISLSPSDVQEPRSFVPDVMGLLSLPCVRAYVLTSLETGDIRWAAVVGAFVRAVCSHAPSLLANYVVSLIPSIATIIRPLCGLFRMNLTNEFRIAAMDSRQRDLRLSLLGPLALFFLESLARAEMAWDCLVEAGNAPRRRRYFGWAASVEPLVSALRRAILGYAHRQPRRKALLYSPLARYLIEMGLVHRVAVDRQQHPGPCTADMASAGCGTLRPQRRPRWLLASDCISRCRASAGNAAIVLGKAEEPPSWAMPEAAVDCRTGRSTPTPAEELELRTARLRLDAATRRLVSDYLHPSRPQVKRLALWAHAAGVDPDALRRPQILNEESIMALAETMLSRRISGCSVAELNRSMAVAACVPGEVTYSPFTASQVRTYLTRLRQDFQDVLAEEKGE